MRNHLGTKPVAAMALLLGLLTGLAGCADTEDGTYHIHYHWQPTSPPSNASVD